jgi:hypothetical protein
MQANPDPYGLDYSVSPFSQWTGGEVQPDSDGYCPMLQIVGALRSAFNRHTGYTASRLMLGREVNTPADLILGTVREDPPVDIEAYLCVGLGANGPDSPWDGDKSYKFYTG